MACFDRRTFLSAAGAAVFLGGNAALAKEEEEVSPVEDLMREHGVLRRLLLAYGEIARRLDGNRPVDAELVARAAQIVKAFIEDYHERDEEEHLFPRFRQAGKLVELVDVLVEQHQAGRRLTAEIQKSASAAALRATETRQRMAEQLRQFVRMYEPHAAREDTVLFPAFAELVGEREMKKLQELFEKKEKALPLGDFERMVAAVGQIEQGLGIYELKQFTPRA